MFERLNGLRFRKLCHALVGRTGVCYAVVFGSHASGVTFFNVPLRSFLCATLAMG